MPINDPTKFVTSYTGDSNNITLPVASLNDGLVDVNDIKEVVYALLEEVSDVYLGNKPMAGTSTLMTATDRSANMVISKASSMASDSQMRKSFTITFLLDVDALEVTDD